MNYENEMQEIELAPVATSYMAQYGINVNLQRAIPMVSDGLKPIWRRILYAIYKYYRNAHEVKVATAVGDVLKFSPHGDLGLKDIFAGLAQPFSNNVPLLIAHGNCGTETAGKDAAAARYWGVSLSPLVLDVYFDEFDGKVNMIPNYDNTLMEPFTLPCKFPMILLNGTSGIGYTLSSDIHPYNLGEVADATIKLLKNPSAKVNLIPDSPTGCDIIVKDAETFIMQSSFELDNVNYVITIKNTPYKRYLNDIDADLRKIQDSAVPIPEILSADDESDLIAGKVRYVIRCKPCNLYNVINTLFKRVPGFRATISARNMLVVVSDSAMNMRNQHFNIRQILCAWIANRLPEKRAWYLRELVSKTTDYNMLEGKAFMLSKENIEKTVKIFRNAKTRADIIPALVDGYKGKVTSSQANYMAEVRMYNLTIEEYNKTLKQMDKIKEEIDSIRDIVNDPEKVKETIIDDIKTIKAKYNFPRRSKILNIGKNESVNIGVVQIRLDGAVVFAETENPEHLASDVTAISGEDVCLIDDKGQFLWINTNNVAHDKPVTLTSIGKTTMGRCVSAVSNMENDIVLLTNYGRVKYMPINRIPSNASKKPLIPDMENGEEIINVLEIHDDSQDILIYTNDGYGKRIPVTSLNKVLSVDAKGQIIMPDIDEHPVSGMFVLNANKPFILYVTRLGKVRLNQLKFLTAGKKFAGLKPIIKLSPQDDLVAVFCVEKEQTVVLNHADSRITSININSLEPTTMSTPPNRPKHVPAVKVIRATIS
jgi:DNA gyrase/topoisomerase IV subunit A